MIYLDLKSFDHGLNSKMAPKKPKASVSNEQSSNLTLQDVYDLLVKNHDSISESIDSIKASLKSVKNSAKKNTQDIKNVSSSLSQTNTTVEHNEQNSRLNSVRLINGPTLPRDMDCAMFMVNLLNKYLGGQLSTKITVMDIDVAHKLGHEKNGRQDYIIKFVRRYVRDQVFYKKKFFAESNSGVSNPTKAFLSEDLTATRRAIMKNLSSMHKDKKIHAFWSLHGEIFVKSSETSDRLKIKISTDFEDVRFQIFGNSVKDADHITDESDDEED